MKKTIVSCLFVLACPVKADDTELFVNILPANARPNVLMIYDTSGSMLIHEPSTGQQRHFGASQAAIDFINSAQNINFGLMSFEPEQAGTAPVPRF